MHKRKVKIWPEPVFLVCSGCAFFSIWPPPLTTFHGVMSFTLKLGSGPAVSVCRHCAPEMLLVFILSPDLLPHVSFLFC